MPKQPRASCGSGLADTLGIFPSRCFLTGCRVVARSQALVPALHDQGLVSFTPPFPRDECQRQRSATDCNASYSTCSRGRAHHAWGPQRGDSDGDACRARGPQREAGVCRGLHPPALWAGHSSIVKCFILATSKKFRLYFALSAHSCTPQVQDKSIVDIATELARLQALAAAGRISPQDVAHGTISISNIGAAGSVHSHSAEHSHSHLTCIQLSPDTSTRLPPPYFAGSIGGTYATPIVTPPEIAIVALGRIQRLPRFDHHGAVVRCSMSLIYWLAVR